MADAAPRDTEVPVGLLRGESIAGGGAFGDGGVLPCQETPFDRAVAQYGLVRVVNLMLADPKVGGTIDMIKTAVLADGIDVTPSHLPKFGGDADDEPEGWEQGDAAHAFEVGQFVARCLDRITGPFPAETFVWQMLDHMIFGCKLAEKVWALDEDGIDAGKMVLAKVKVKDQLAWSFVRDDFGNVLGVSPGWLAADRRAPLGGLGLVPREKVVVFTWNPANDDPRGRTLCRRIYDPFYEKFQTRVKYAKYRDKFAGPTWVGSVGPAQQPRPVKDPQTGAAIRDRLPEDDLLESLIKLESCSALALAHGATAEPKFPAGNGEAFLNALAYFDRQIVTGIFLAARATEEAQHGSRADSESAQDMVGTLIRWVKQSAAKAIRDDLARYLVLYNYGKDWADRYTPTISLGKTEHQDFSRNAGAVSKLWAAGFLDEGQRPGLCTFMGLPLPKPRKPEPARADQPEPAPGGPATKPQT